MLPYRYSIQSNTCRFGQPSLPETPPLETSTHHSIAKLFSYFPLAWQWIAVRCSGGWSVEGIASIYQKTSVCRPNFAVNHGDGFCFHGSLFGSIFGLLMSKERWIGLSPMISSAIKCRCMSRVSCTNKFLQIYNIQRIIPMRVE